MITKQQIDEIVRAALHEDAPWGDVTGDNLVPVAAIVEASLAAREPGVMAGAAFVPAAFTALDPTIQVEIEVNDGEPFGAGSVLARISGPARAVLQAERVALNLVQRACGIATLTSRYVAAVDGTRARIVDTRKTTPLLRPLEKHAVTCGGGHNHRYSLSDAVMVKDNHLAALGTAGLDVTTALLDLRARLPHTTHIEVEVDRIDQIEPVLAAGVDSIMLDNFALDDLRAGVRVVAGRALVEASGGVNLDTVRAIAETGIDVISVGALTHSARALDLGLDFL